MVITGAARGKKLVIAILCLVLGADLLGFIFVASTRQSLIAIVRIIWTLILCILTYRGNDGAKAFLAVTLLLEVVAIGISVFTNRDLFQPLGLIIVVIPLVIYAVAGGILLFSESVSAFTESQRTRDR